MSPEEAEVRLESKVLEERGQVPLSTTGRGVPSPSSLSHVGVQSALIKRDGGCGLDMGGTCI